MMSISLLLLSILCITINSHVCMWQPMQRGNFSIDSPGLHVPCYKKEGPCGSNNITGIRTSIESGSTYTISFQQNLNHYYTVDPGHFDITFGIGQQPKESDFNITLHKINDYNAMNEITQTNFTFNVTMPDIECDECVIRLRYLTNNPLEDDRGTIFYQCSDIKLTKNPIKSKAKAIAVDSVDSVDSVDVKGDCCGPQQFSTNFVHKIPDIDYEANGIIYYDAINQYQRMDVQIGNGEGTTIYDGQFSMISNFSNGIEYYLNINNKTCSLFGLDYWNNWCFGSEYNQSEILTNLSIECINTMNDAKECKQWINGDFIFQAYNGKEECLPSSMSRKNGEIWLYHGFKSGPFDISIFTPSPICDHRSSQYVGCSKKRLHELNNK